MSDRVIQLLKCQVALMSSLKATNWVKFISLLLQLVPTPRATRLDRFTAVFGEEYTGQDTALKVKVNVEHPKLHPVS